LNCVAFATGEGSYHGGVTVTAAAHFNEERDDGIASLGGEYRRRK
jgi:hypothetical protein